MVQLRRRRCVVDFVCLGKEMEVNLEMCDYDCDNVFFFIKMGCRWNV